MARSVLISLSATAVLACGYLALKTVEFQSLEQQFSRIQPGDHVDQVTRLLGSPDLIRSGPRDRYNLERLVKRRDASVAIEYRYVFNTFFLPVVWVVGFDADGRVISRHRFD